MANIQDRDSRNNGRWTKTQHEKFLLGLQLYGKNWKKIQQLIGSRTGAQIRSHAQKFFLKSKPDSPLNQQVHLDSSNPLELNLSVISKQINQTSFNQQHQQKQKQFSSQKQQFYFQQQFSLQFFTQSSYYIQEIMKIEIANRNKKDREFSFWELIDFGGKSQQKQEKTENMREREAEKEKQKQNKDIQPSEDNLANIQENRRKDSFVVFDHCNDSRQETAFPHLSMLGEPIV